MAKAHSPRPSICLCDGHRRLDFGNLYVGFCYHAPAMRKVWCMYGVLAATPFVLWLLPSSWRLHGHLLGVPVAWGMIAFALFPEAGWGFPGRRRFWPFVWIVGLLGLSLGL